MNASARIACLAALAMLLSACAVPRIIVHEDPLTSADRLRLGLAYEQEGKDDLAEQEYRRALSGEPLAHLALANLLFRQERFKEAEQSYDRAVRALPDDPEPRNNLAWLLLTQGRDLDRAERLAEEAVALALDPTVKAACENTLASIRAARAAKSGG